MIDDLEDGDGEICNSAGRHGSWYTVSDGTTNAVLEPSPGQPFTPTLIDEGRGASHYAAHMTGSGFSDWGARMGFNLNVQDLRKKPYDVGMTGGVKFWMKSNKPVVVNLPVPATISINEDGGICSDSANEYNCGNHFQFLISAPDPSQWVEYDVPFAALAQSVKNDNMYGNTVFGSASWSPASLVAVEFSVSLLPSSIPPLSFDVWVDDVQFYDCPTSASCVPKCADPNPVACPVSGATQAGCWPLGTVCSTVPVVAKNLRGVSGSGPSDVWAVGGYGHGATILHWNGAAWSTPSNSPTPPLNAVWGSGPGDVWAVGDYGTIVHKSGLAFSALPGVTSQSLSGVWGSSPNDVWAVGHGGIILHWNGSTWSPVPSGTNLWLTGVWGSSPSDVWAVGLRDFITYQGIILHWNGSAWSSASNGAPQPLLDVWGSGPGDVWAVGPGIVHWDGSIWSGVASGTARDFVGISSWGSGPHDVWVVGASGTIVHWDGSTWSAVLSDTTQDLYRVWGNGPGDVWAVGDYGTIVHWNGTSWFVVPKMAIR